MNVPKRLGGAPRAAILLAAILPAFALTGGALASEADARAAVDRFFVVWNAADNAGLADVIHLPHVFLVGEAGARVAKTEGEIAVDFDAMSRREGWAKSTLESVDTTYVSPDKVHFELVFSRQNAQGETYTTLAALWIMTLRDERWGVQVRSILGPPDAMRDPTGTAAGQGAAQAFIAAWNTASNDALRSAMHFPFVTLFGDRLVVAEEAEGFSTDFEALRSGQGWARSSFDSFDVVRATTTKVHAAVDFSRYRADGTRYGGGRMLYVFTRRGEHWGMQLRTPIADRSAEDE
ncbi:MAG: hypothetical protein VYE73_03105 [Acidobacteriota bacterium]|nr:hypothetical protein [Acidobacteriota bacterium]